ncbi:GlyGly-CTERM sorting domain-containing protein [uncultured Gordonia sp.]
MTRAVTWWSLLGAPGCGVRRDQRFIAGSPGASIKKRQ